jgi:hypothetical protein
MPAEPLPRRYVDRTDQPAVARTRATDRLREATTSVAATCPPEVTGTSVVSVATRSCMFGSKRVGSAATVEDA